MNTVEVAHKIRNHLIEIGQLVEVEGEYDTNKNLTYLCFLRCELREEVSLNVDLFLKELDLNSFKILNIIFFLSLERNGK